jgi:hypothetical protein
VRQETDYCLGKAYPKEVLRAVKSLEFFDESDLLFYWKDTLKGISLRKKQKVVSLTEMRHLYIGLLAIEITMRERLKG